MKYQSPLKDNTLKCEVCPRGCLLKEGQRGFCHIRQNLNGKISLTSYGYTTGLAIDPIEKKPLYHFYPSSKVLSFGTLGCNMGCMFCQNWHISKSKEDTSLLQKVAPAEIARIAKDYDCKSIAFTYNDPVIFLEYAIDTAQEAHKLGIKTVAVTAGYINQEARKDLFDHIDAANVDLKSFSEKFYRKNCLASLEPVLETLKYIKQKTNVWLEITTLLIEGENDSDEEIKKECEWIKNNLGTNTPIHFSAFHPSYKFKNYPRTKSKTLLKACDIALKTGLNYVYTGNIQNIETSSTYCKNCKNIIIKRNGFMVEEFYLDNDGKCIFCKTQCNGDF